MVILGLEMHCWSSLLFALIEYKCRTTSLSLFQWKWDGNDSCSWAMPCHWQVLGVTLPFTLTRYCLLRQMWHYKNRQQHWLWNECYNNTGGHFCVSNSVWKQRDPKWEPKFDKITNLPCFREVGDWLVGLFFFLFCLLHHKSVGPPPF